jgi:hypothetical protein
MPGVRSRLCAVRSRRQAKVSSSVKEQAGEMSDEEIPAEWGDTELASIGRRDLRFDRFVLFGPTGRGLR